MGKGQRIGFLVQVCFYYGILSISSATQQFAYRSKKHKRKPGEGSYRGVYRSKMLTFFLLSFNGERKWMKMMISTLVYGCDT